MTTTAKSDVPRPRPKFKGKPAYITTKVREDQMRFINRVAGPRPGGKAAALRDLLDLGIKAARSRVARC
jgi:hypothetical protein